MAISSVLAVAAGIVANIISADDSTRSPATYTALVLISAGFIYTITWTSSRGRLRPAGRKESSKIEEYEAALRRITIALSEASDAPLARSPVDLDLMVSVGPHPADDIDSERRVQTTSAFVAKLTQELRCTVVTGVAGSGKSTLLRFLAQRMIRAREQSDLRFSPLLLPCATWQGSTSFTGWVSDQTHRLYGIPADLTRSWMNQGTTVLILDGLDEIPTEKWRNFTMEINRWLASPVGGRAVLSCRTDAYLREFRNVLHEQVANLEPLSNSAIQQYFTRVLSQRVSDTHERDELHSLFLRILWESGHQRPEWSTPLLTRLLADALPKLGNDRTSREESDDPGEVALELGDRLTLRGDWKAAVESYLAAANSPSHWRSIAGARACLLLARTGDFQAARQMLETSLAAEIEEALRGLPKPIADHLSDDERKILGVLSTETSLDAYQVGSYSSVPPSRCNEALRRLRDRGLINVVGGSGEPRFRRSLVELVD